MDQDIYVELWVDDDALSEFLRLHMNEGVRIPIYNAGHILFTGPLAEAKARLDYMKNIEDKCVVVLYLGDFDPHAYEGYMYRRAAFSGRVDLLTGSGSIESISLGCPLNRPSSTMTTDRSKTDCSRRKSVTTVPIQRMPLSHPRS